MNKLLPFAAAAVIAAGAAFFWPVSNSSELTAFGAAEAQEADAEVDTSIVKEMVLGTEDAPLTIVEYASATCPHCRNFHLGTFREFKENYVDTGKVRFVYREVYFDRFGLWAGMVARCGMPTEEDADSAVIEASRKRYFAIMDLIFEKQQDWLEGDSPAAIAQNLATIGKSAGLSADQVDTCMQDAEMAKALVAVFEQNSKADDVTSTPTFFVGGEKITGARSYDEFSELVDAQLGEE
ncbi:DsbA family protein [Pseudoruegeria sp. HB172150]|uniref:DsbA family protein n=1 Tax=Pseudoruegeria sp. HB172150 TaxID=2721164 RepID=UPI001555CFB1|nr:DsbA family protein [Pseudoruegeria sp. HB172150]